MYSTLSAVHLHVELKNRAGNAIKLSTMLTNREYFRNPLCVCTRCSCRCVFTSVTSTIMMLISICSTQFSCIAHKSFSFMMACAVCVVRNVLLCLVTQQNDNWNLQCSCHVSFSPWLVSTFDEAYNDYFFLC